MATIARNTIFTNVALTPDGGVWWEGMTDEPPAECLDWQGQRVDAGDRGEHGQPAAHPNARFTRAARPVSDHRPGWEDPDGVPDQRVRVRRAPRDDDAARLSGVQLDSRRLRRRDDGARRPRRRPSATSATLRRDPMAMLPFCGYHMGDYFRHWIKMQRVAARDAEDLPRELVQEGRRRTVSSGPASARTCACWKWIVDRVRGRALAKETPIGWMPRFEDLDWTGLPFPKEHLRRAAVRRTRPRGSAR